METAHILSVVSTICIALFTAIIALLCWGGNKLIMKLEQMEKSCVHQCGLFYKEINELDGRLTVVETKCHINHRRKDDNP